MLLIGGWRLWVTVFGVAAAVGGGYLLMRAPEGAAAAVLNDRDAAARTVDDSVRAPDGVRVRVEVLNASRVRGMARRATMELRDRGFDVVAIGNSGELRDSTLVLYRSGEQEWARRVARAVGGATVEMRPDSSRYVEVSVLLGASWRPPPGPFRP